MKNRLMLRRAVCALLILGVAACRPAPLYYVEPSGPTEYQLGWQDGCDTGLSAQGGIFYQALYGFKKRPEMGNNELYKQAWNEGFTYCRFTYASMQDGKW